MFCSLSARPYEFEEVPDEEDCTEVQGQNINHSKAAYENNKWYQWGYRKYKAVEEDVREEEVSSHLNAYYCPPIGGRLLEKLPKLPLETGVMKAMFEYGSLVPSSSEAENGIKRIKVDTYKGKLPKQIDDFMQAERDILYGDCLLSKADLDAHIPNSAGELAYYFKYINH